MPEFTPTQGRYLAYIHAYTEGCLRYVRSNSADAKGAAGMVKTHLNRSYIS
jgi:hypothetical protein